MGSRRSAGHRDRPVLAADDRGRGSQRFQQARPGSAHGATASIGGDDDLRSGATVCGGVPGVIRMSVHGYQRPVARLMSSRCAGAAGRPAGMPAHTLAGRLGSTHRCLRLPRKPCSRSCHRCHYWADIRSTLPASPDTCFGRRLFSGLFVPRHRRAGHGRAMGRAKWVTPTGYRVAAPVSSGPAGVGRGDEGAADTTRCRNLGSGRGHPSQRSRCK
jgi:hypothetical protein